VPLAAAGAVAVIASGVFSADAKSNLPAESAAQLLASVGQARVAAFSGTVVEKASLGLPDLPGLSQSSGVSGSQTNLLGMLTGSHTLRVWYGGETQQRVSLLTPLGEQSIFRNGRDLWQWNSDTRQASHTVLPADAGSTTPSDLPTLTPPEAAQQALALLDPSTLVNTDHTGVVAGRSTYTLVLTPKDTRSRVGEVRISVDGKTKTPLGVQVIGRDSQKVALDVSFTRVEFGVPDADNFTFRPPASVHVVQAPALTGTAGQFQQASHSDVKTIGSGWTAIGEITGVPSISQLAGSDPESASVLRAMPAVSGAWGKGRLFSSDLLTALLTDDGRVFVGFVDPELLYQAAAK
jgi:outer membrane lipoprotein-sorting protein